ncbi:MAG: SAM-dependent methyltransferase [Actinomycetota bacterium]
MDEHRDGPPVVPDAQTLRYHEIAEAGHRILNPFSEAKLDLLGDVAPPPVGGRHLDLACGKGELLCRWARRFGGHGTGVDVSAAYLAEAAARASELGVVERVRLVRADAATHEAPAAAFDTVSCLGATWIGGGLVGTLGLMAPALAPGGSLLVGEPYWHEPPPEDARSALAQEGDVADLAGTLERVESAGWELVEMVLADGDDWDRYVASQWRTMSDWLRAHPEDPDAPTFAVWLDGARRAYLAYERRYLGWGVFVLRRA